MSNINENVVSVNNNEVEKVASVFSITNAGMCQKAIQIMRS